MLFEPEVQRPALLAQSPPEGLRGDIIGGMRHRYWLGMGGCLLVTALALSQTNQQPADSQSTDSQSTNSQPAAQPANSKPANQRPIKPSAVAAAASASRLAHQSAPPSRVIRNNDISDDNPPEAAQAAPKVNGAAAIRAAQDRETREDERKTQQFEAQGKTFQNQVKAQKNRIVDLQNRVEILNDQFDAWSTSHRHIDPAICWAAQRETYYYKSWCDIGRNLKTQMESSQNQLAQEKARLEQMQENIRRAGYGNTVYEPD